MTQRSIATVSVSGTLDEKLQAIAEAGFDAVEIFENDLLAFNRTAARGGCPVQGSRPVDLRVPAISRL